MEPLTGLEPAWINVRSVAPFQLGYRGKELERQVGFEPTISTLARLRDTGLRYCRIGSRGGNRTRDVLLNRQTPTANIGPLNRNGCREGNRTLAVWLMRPNCEPSLPASNFWWSV